MNAVVLGDIQSPAVPKAGLPSWFKQELPSESVSRVSGILAGLNIHTVCRQAQCPNINHCFKNNRATFLILGNICTRGCQFCGIAKSGGGFLGIDKDQPRRVAEAIRLLGIKYAVITSVTRDDITDGGASVFSETVRAIRRMDTAVKIELLIPDFCGRLSSLVCVSDSGPDVLAHNIETVKRLYPDLRLQADYGRSLEVLRRLKEMNRAAFIKSSLMLGLGETEAEVIQAMRDLRDASCDCLVLGQYLSPGSGYYPVKEFISPQRFLRYKDIGLNMGFLAVLSEPKARSSFRAEEVYNGFMHA